MAAGAAPSPTFTRLAVVRLAYFFAGRQTFSRSSENCLRTPSSARISSVASAISLRRKTNGEV